MRSLKNEGDNPFESKDFVHEIHISNFYIEKSMFLGQLSFIRTAPKNVYRLSFSLLGSDVLERSTKTP